MHAKQIKMNLINIISCINKRYGLLLLKPARGAAQIEFHSFSFVIIFNKNNDGDWILSSLRPLSGLDFGKNTANWRNSSI